MSLDQLTVYTNPQAEQTVVADESDCNLSESFMVAGQLTAKTGGVRIVNPVYSGSAQAVSDILSIKSSHPDGKPGILLVAGGHFAFSAGDVPLEEGKDVTLLIGDDSENPDFLQRKPLIGYFLPSF
jgi:hypothetical protein